MQSILAVDDSPSMRKMVSFTLSGAGYKVVEAVDGMDALEKAEAQQIDLVLADHSMPGMTGTAMAVKILGHDPKARIVICTGHVEPDLEIQAKKAGVAGFLMKPMTPRTLVENIQRLRR